MFGFGPKTCAVVTQQTWINKQKLLFKQFTLFFLISGNKKKKKVPDV
jgi:hypothetical protein